MDCINCKNYEFCKDAEYRGIAIYCAYDGEEDNNESKEWN